MTALEDRDTWEQRSRFKLRRIGVDGPFHLPIEAITDPPLPILTEGFISLELKEGTTQQEAQALLDAINEKVAYVTYTGMIEPGMLPCRKASKINKED